MLEQKLKTIRNLVTAANVLVLISIFVAGIPLGIAAIVCGILAYRKYSVLDLSGELDQKLSQFYFNKIRMVLILSAVIFVINCISAYMMYPYYADMVNQYFNGGAGASGASSSIASGSNNGSIWG